MAKDSLPQNKHDKNDREISVSEKKQRTFSTWIWRKSCSVSSCDAAPAAALIFCTENKMINCLGQSKDQTNRFRKDFVSCIGSQNQQLPGSADIQFANHVLQRCSVEQLEITILKLQNATELCAKLCMPPHKRGRDENMPLGLDRWLKS